MARHRRKYLRPALAAAAVSAACPAGGALAQEFNEVQAVIKPQLALERSRYLRRLISMRGDALMRDRLTGSGAGPAVYPLAYGEDGADGAPQEADPAGISVWTDGAGTWLKDSQALRGYEGTQYIVSAGADMQVSDRLILGAIGVHSGSDVDNIFVPGGSATRGFGLGPYAAVFLTDTIVLTASAVHSWTDNDLDSGAVTASYDSRDWTVNADISSYHFFGNWQVVPSAGVSYAVETEDAYVDSAATAFAASTTRTGSVVAGGRIAYTHEMANGMTVEPGLEAELEWLFERSTTATSSVPADTGRFDASVTGGVDVQMSEGASLSLGGSVGGLARPDYLSATGSARLTVSF